MVQAIVIVLLILALLSTLYLIAHIPAAIYLKRKNPSAEVSISAPAYVIPIVLWLATLVMFFVQLLTPSQ